MESESVTLRTTLLQASAMKRSPLPFDRDTRRVAQLGAGRGPAVTAVAVAQSIVSRDGGNHARGELDLTDDVVVAVGDEKIFCAVDGDGSRAASSALVAAKPSPL